MNIGIVLRYYKKSKFGFIKTYNQSIFFHFNERQTYINRTDIVVFDIEESAKGLIAKNIQCIDSIEGLTEKLYTSSDEKLKWVLVEKYPELYAREERKYLDTVNSKAKTDTEFKTKLNNFNKYIDQFTSDIFWNQFEVGVGAKWNTLGGRDWTEAWWNYGIESKYKIEKIDKFTTVEDPYILNFLRYWNHILKVDWATAKYENTRKRKELNFKEDYLEGIKNNIKHKFDNEYSKEEHIKSLQFYYPKMNILEQKYKGQFAKIAYENFSEFVSNNLKHNETIHPTKREIDEDFEAEYL